MRTLLLNAGYEPMMLVGWQRALCLVLSDKAEIVEEYSDVVRTISKSYKMPSVIRLNRYVRFITRFGVAKCNRRNILIRDQYRCQYCGILCSNRTASIDHIIPRSKGGTTDWFNVVLACHDCNRSKGNKSVKEAGFKLRSKPKAPSWRELITAGHAYVDSTWMPYVEDESA